MLALIFKRGHKGINNGAQKKRNRQMNIGYNEKIETLILALHRGQTESIGKFGQSFRDSSGMIHIRMFDGKSFTASCGSKFWHIENVGAQLVGNDPDLLIAISYAL